MERSDSLYIFKKYSIFGANEGQRQRQNGVPDFRFQTLKNLKTDLGICRMRERRNQLTVFKDTLRSWSLECPSAIPAAQTNQFLLQEGLHILFSSYIIATRTFLSSNQVYCLKCIILGNSRKPLNFLKLKLDTEQNF